MPIGRCHTNGLYARNHPRAVARTGEVTGDAVLRFRPDIMQLPRYRVIWDGFARETTILKSFVDFDDDAETS